MIRVRHICIRHADELISCVKSKLLKERYAQIQFYRENQNNIAVITEELCENYKLQVKEKIMKKNCID